MVGGLVYTSACPTMSQERWLTRNKVADEANPRGRVQICDIKARALLASCRCHGVRVIICFSAHCPGKKHQNKKFLCTCIQWSRRISSSQLIPNFVHGSRHAAQVYNRANGCSPQTQMKECPSLYLVCHVG